MRDWKDLRILTEARKNPDKNPKLSVAHALEPYLDDNSMHVSFNDIATIGINPQSEWRTPQGVYTYQLNDFKKRIRKELAKDDPKDMRTLNVFPYASERRYIFVIKAKSGLKWLRMKGKTVSKNEYQTYVENLIDWTINHKELGKSAERFARRQLDQLSKAEFKKASDTQRKMQTRLALRKLFQDLKHYGNYSIDLYYHTSTFIRTITGYQPQKGTVMINAALRKVGGFDAIRDDGTGTVATGERHQVAFLHPKAYTVVDRIDNRDLSRRNRLYGQASGNVSKQGGQGPMSDFSKKTNKQHFDMKFNKSELDKKILADLDATFFDD